ncbi:two-component system, OmpR family, response regulator [Dyella jiangningensis]|uniref:response regulator transcription factor n=1 Tax=Dyella sp. AtDHG13 TaxID=1938897 RepID=UPI0008848598|nr:response regulator transcription factor [Dyella sp. AtDHG13]PXV61595.1 two-component system OmpR family response regulator [Dyella sp. AtDHG13]SDJ70240.1 two-component system, OmpR family, response regulator [Dyella jiangningensis]
MRCLLIEDDIPTAELIREGLAEAGHQVEACHDGATGLARVSSERWDLVVLDRMLPDAVDGLDILAAMRLRDDRTPVLVLSALSSLDERVRGLRSGGDDYLTKPFALDEMLARVEALARRAGQRPEPDVLSAGDLTLEPRTRRVFRNGHPVPLQPREYQLLEYLMRHQGEVVTRKMLLAAVWGFHFDPETNVIDVQMSRLRNKIDQDGAAPLIRTVRGVGFTLGAGRDEPHAAE